MVPGRYSMPTKRNVTDRHCVLFPVLAPMDRLGQRGGIRDLILVLLVQDLVASDHEGLLLAAFNNVRWERQFPSRAPRRGTLTQLNARIRHQPQADPPRTQ
jgi:hypothetical protein